MANQPSILFGGDSPFGATALSQNVAPAGTEDIQNRPSPTWPFANVIPGLNAMWLKPGMLLEPGTGFAARQAQAQVAGPPLGFPFFFPWLNYNPGSYPTVPAVSPTEMQAGSTGLGGLKFPKTPGEYTLPGDTQAEIERANEAIRQLEEFSPRQLEGVPGSAIESQFGTEPKFSLDPGAATSGLDPGDYSLLDRPSPGIQAANNLNRAPFQFNWPNEADLANPVRWDTTGFSVTGEGPSTFPSDLGVQNAALPPAAASFTAPAAAAAVAIPALTGLVTDDPQVRAAAQMAGAGFGTAATIGSFTGAGAAGAAGAAGLGGLAGIAGPAIGVTALPLIIGTALDALRHAYPSMGWGRSAPPTGFISIPDRPGSTTPSGNYVNPQTGEIISRKGRWGFEYGGQSKDNLPVTPEQAREWGIPIPGVDLSPEEVLRANPLFYQRLNAAPTGFNPGGVLRAEGRTANAPVTVNDVRSTFTPGWQVWDSGIKALQAVKENANASPGEIWRQWSSSPEGQAFLIYGGNNSGGR